MEWVLLTIALSFAISVILYTWITGAPPYPSSRGEKERVIQLLRVSKWNQQGVVYELGCGWGGLAGALGKEFPEAKVIGIERSPFPYLISKLRSLFWTNVDVVWGDFHQINLSNADAVVSYLMIHPMVPLAEKLDRELIGKVPVVTVSFLFRERSPDLILEGKGIFVAQTALYWWKNHK